MKATLNGALHVSELDGWWAEAYLPGLGWALGEGIPEDVSDDVRDHAEGAQLMDLLENQIVPLYFLRDASGLPHVWLERMQRSIQAQLSWGRKRRLHRSEHCNSKEMVPLNPPLGVAVTDMLVDCPCTTLAVSGETTNVKSPVLTTPAGTRVANNPLERVGPPAVK